MVYGRPALAAAIDLRLTVRATPLPQGVRLELPCLPHAEETTWEAVRAYARAARATWGDYAAAPAPERFRAVRGVDPAHIVKAALGEALESLKGTPAGGLLVRVDSELPIGSGFGSSAATAVAVVAAFLASQGAEADAGVIERIALDAERRQHGLPSGIDGAAVLHGGLLWARKLPEGGLETERIAVRSPLLSLLRVYDTGMPPEPTGAVVAAVRSLRDRGPAAHERRLDRIEAAVRAFRAELESAAGDAVRALQAIRDCESALEEMGVVPGPVRDIVRKVEMEGGAAKVSGAGSLAGPGAGSLLVYHPDPERITGWGFLQPFPFHAVHLGAEGLRRETDA
ncbi:MAG: mevalonate kinase [Thermoanaerobaculia bacterium]